MTASATDAPQDQPGKGAGLWLSDMVTGYRLRWKRRRLLWRAFRAAKVLRPVVDRRHRIGPDDILAVVTVRNEALRLPHFLDHYRALGVGHFLIVDNASTDATQDLLRAAPDVSVWTTDHSYRDARFGMDWANWLLSRHCHGHWTVTVDADELLIFSHWQSRGLAALTDWLDGEGITAFPAMMLDLYPKGPIDQRSLSAGADPTEALCWFDGGNYVARPAERMKGVWVQGGVRMRCFFADRPELAPTLNKLPLVRWNWRYTYVNSTHYLLPRRLNGAPLPGVADGPSGLLLHTKFLPDAPAKAAEDQKRRVHFARPADYEAYNAALTQAPDLWCPASRRLGSWRELEAMGLMSRGGWH
jgi:Glycosyl transferase family 2